MIELLADALEAQLTIALAVTASPSQARIQKLLTIMSRLAGLFPGSKTIVSCALLMGASTRRDQDVHLVVRS